MNQKTFNTFLDIHQASLYRMIRSRVSSEQDAEDILQEVLVKIYQNHERFHGHAQLKTWFYTICKNTTADYFRKPWWKFSWILQTQEQQDDSSRQPEQQFLEKEQQQHLQAMLLTLPPREGEVFRLRFFDHFSLQEIAECQNSSLSTIKTQLYTGVKKIRELVTQKRGSQ